MLKGINVILRPIERKDVRLLIEWFNDKEVTQNLTQYYLPFTQERGISWIETINVSKKDIFLIIELRRDSDKLADEPIGIAGIQGINWKDKNAIGFVIIGEKDHWGKGYGMELAELFLGYCFETLNLHRISTSVISFNKRSVNLHKRLGFTQEGCQKEAVFKDGNYHDLLLFGLLRSDWKK